MPGFLAVVPAGFAAAISDLGALPLDFVKKLSRDSLRAEQGRRAPVSADDYLPKLEAAGIEISVAKLKSVIACLAFIFNAAISAQPTLKEFGRRINKMSVEPSVELLELLATLWEKEGLNQATQNKLGSELIDVKWRLSVPLGGSSSQQIHVKRPQVHLTLTVADSNNGGTKTQSLVLSYPKFLEFSRSMHELHTQMRAAEAHTE
eukprot:TRINITY_DN4253_c0_g1_i1.p1 TRINITY_DN4253_c0_g1~~TRINITY_DN4253_c0_g1_i1.p1  ORF type:complete len:205 (+),score=29.37 TRINITY_DN4253_c0_g1_i1:39-653(+)